MQVITDFNETLVRERTLPEWCRRRVRHGPLPARLGAALKCALLGPISVACDLLGRDVLAARVGLFVFRGHTHADLAAFARAGLTPNPRAFEILERLARESGALHLTVISRGTPAAVVRAFLANEPIRRRLQSIALAGPPKVVAPELELVAGRCTGRLRDLPGAKADRAELLEPGSVFLGDRRDQRWARHALADRDSTFIAV